MNICKKVIRACGWYLGQFLVYCVRPAVFTSRYVSGSDCAV